MKSILSMVAIVLGSAVVFFIAALFVTGLAQEKILPRLLGKEPPSAAADSLAADSLGAPSSLPEGLEGDRDTASSAPGGSAGTADSEVLSASVSPTSAPTDSSDRQSFLQGTASSPEEALLAQIETEKSTLTREREELERLRASIDSLVATIHSVQSEAVSRQAKVLAGMKAEDAGRVISSMDDATALAIIQKMNARAASALLAKLDPRRAARFASHGVRVSGAENIVSELTPAYGGQR